MRRETCFWCTHLRIVQNRVFVCVRREAEVLRHDIKGDLVSLVGNNLCVIVLGDKSESDLAPLGNVIRVIGDDRCILNQNDDQDVTMAEFTALLPRATCYK